MAVPDLTVPEPLVRRAISDAVLTRLGALAETTVYDGEIPTQPPVKITNGAPDPSGRPGRYVVLFPSPGTPTSDGADLADTHVDLTITYLLHAAAGWRRDCEQLVGDIDALLHRWSPDPVDELAGCAISGMRPPAGYDPGPLRFVRALEEQPARFWTPLQYQLTATR